MGNSITDVCVIIGRNGIPEWMLNSLERMIEETNAEISLVIRTNSSKSSSVENESEHVLSKFRTLVKEFLVQNPQNFIPVEDATVFEEAHFIEATLQPADGLGVQASSTLIDKVREQSDVAIIYSVGILKGDILESPEHGILSFHGGDFYRYRGGPAGFWEYIKGEVKGGMTLQRINETLDAGEIIVFEPVMFDEAYTWWEYRSRIFAAAEPMLATAIKRLKSNEFNPESPSTDELGEMYYLSDINRAVQLKYAIRHTIGLLKERLFPNQK